MSNIQNKCYFYVYLSHSVSDDDVSVWGYQLYMGSFMLTEHCMVQNLPYVYLVKNLATQCCYKAITMVTWMNSCNVIGKGFYTYFYSHHIYQTPESLTHWLESALEMEIWGSVWIDINIKTLSTMNVLTKIEENASLKHKKQALFIFSFLIFCVRSNNLRNGIVKT